MSSHRPVARIPALGHDALKPKRARVAEDGLAVAVQVLAKAQGSLFGGSGNGIHYTGRPIIVSESSSQRRTMRLGDLHAALVIVYEHALAGPGGVG